MRIFIILICALCVASCSAGSLFPSNNMDTQGQIQKELGWNAIITQYNAAIKKCTPIKTDDCVLTADSAQTAIDAHVLFQFSRNECLVHDTCDPCQMANAIADIGSTIGINEFANVDFVCAGGVDINDILDEIEDTPQPERAELVNGIEA